MKPIIKTWTNEEIEIILNKIYPRPQLFSPANKLCSDLFKWQGKVYNVEGLLYYVLHGSLNNSEIMKEASLL